MSINLPTYPQNWSSGQMYNVGIGGFGQAFGAGQYVGVGQYNSGIGSAQWVQNVQSVNQQASPSLPQLTGAYTLLDYRDPVTGNSVALHVDSAYAQILCDIIAMQGMYIPSANIPIVPDGEFSLDEMGQAEDLIQEIEHAH
jgi:hypothetical protein